MKILPLAMAAGAAAVLLGGKKKKRRKKVVNGATAETWKERQRALATMGYYKGPIDGVGDTSLMVATILAFQAANLVVPSGKWNEATQEALVEAMRRHGEGVAGKDTMVVSTDGGETLVVGKFFDRYVLGEFLKRSYTSGKLLALVGAQTAYAEFMGNVYGFLDGRPILLKNLPETDAVKAFNEEVFTKINDVRNFAIEVRAKIDDLGGAEAEAWYMTVVHNLPIIAPIWGGADMAWTHFFGKE